jgi:hypothetical protein
MWFLLVVSLLMFVPLPQVKADTINLNDLLLSKFQNWDAMITREFDVNEGTLQDPYDYALNGAVNTTSGLGYYLPALWTMYEKTSDQYYFAKCKLILDAVLGNSLFNTTVGGIGTIFYVKGYIITMPDEGDSSAMFTMLHGILALKLYSWTGDTKYLTLATRIAEDSLKLVVINNSTDMAWSCSYYLDRDVAHASISLNRQVPIAWFYSYYDSINSTFGAYIPKIINWVFRSQLANGGLGDVLPPVTSNVFYTALVVSQLCKAYVVNPSHFSALVKTKIANAVTFLNTKVHRSYFYLETVMAGTALASAWETDYFIGNITSALVKSYYYFTLSMMIFNNTKGFTISLCDYPQAWRWQQFAVGLFFSNYPLPDGSFSNLQGLTNYRADEGNANLNGFGAEYFDRVTNSGSYGNGFVFWGGSYLRPVGGKLADSITLTNNDYYWRLQSVYGSNTMTMYLYPVGVTVTDVTGSENGWQPYLSNYGTNLKIIVENGTIYTPSSSWSNGQIKTLSKKIMLYYTDGDKPSIMLFSKSTSWTYATDNSSYILLTQNYANKRVISAHNRIDGLITSPATQFSTFSTVVNAFNVTQPVSETTMINTYLQAVYAQCTLASYYSTYYSALTTTPKLLFHSDPITTNITSWGATNSRLTFTISAPSGTTSTTKVYCGDLQKPKSVSGLSSTGTWSYEDS